MCKELWIKSNIVSFLGLLFTMVGICFCFVDKTFIAVLLLVLSGICDGFDGWFAKKFRKEGQNPEYGIQLDSLCDVVCSGVFPVIICLSMGFTEWYSFIIYAFFMVCGITRLTYYNVNSSDKSYFSGLPITCSTFIIPIVFFITQMEVVFMIMMTMLAVFYVLGIKIPKPSIKIKSIFSLIGLVLIIVICYLFVKGIIF